ncbi:MAG: tetratricopeptide repeat protein [Saccharospirillaceae bacterium]|nr:tetratricopeptide repeat protein [Saccharospirillaceae bacterium]
MKLITVILIGLMTLVSGCSYERSNRIVKGFGDSGWVSETEDAPSESERKEEVAQEAKKQHGLMHIHRYGPGYDILLTLDAGDSDIKFVMALPDGQNVLESPQSESDAFEAEDESQVADDLPDPTENHQKMAERIKELEQEKAQIVEQTTRHILSAQSLFYKKEYWKALDETNAALKRLPTSAQAHALKGSIYYKMGLIPEAKASWEEALSLDPEMDQVKTSLARIQ